MPARKIVLILWLLPLALSVGAVSPSAGALLFSGHGGPGWFALPFVLPIAIVGTVRASGEYSQKRRRLLIVAGTALTIGLLLLSERRIEAAIGLEIGRGLLPGVALLPFGLPGLVWSLFRLRAE